MSQNQVDRNAWALIRLCLMVVGSTAIGASTLHAAGEPDRAAASSVQESTLRQLVDQELPRLESDLRSERISAETRLLDAGPDILEFLPALDSITDAATREALRRIRSELELRAARLSLEPGRVTLHGPLTLTEIVEQIELQTGNAVSLGSDDESIGEASVDIEYSSTLFWDVILELTDRLDLQTSEADPQAVVLTPRKTDAPVARTTVGSFRVEVLSVQARGSVVSVELALTPEPRLRPLFLAWSDVDFSGRLLPDRELRPFSPDARRELPTVDRGRSAFSVVFQRPSDDEASAATADLSGKVIVTTAALTREFRFRDLTGQTAESQRTAGVSVTRRSADFSTTRRGIHRAEIELRVAYDTGGPAFESHRTWVYHNEVYLETPDGERLPVNDGFETLGDRDGSVAVRYRFRELPDVPSEDWQLVYHAPTAVIEVPVEFEFEQLAITGEPGL